MMELEKSLYSLFPFISEVNTLSEKKEFKGIVDGLIDTVCELNNIQLTDEIKYIDLDLQIIDFLFNIGIMQDIEEIEKLKTILDESYNKLIYVINYFLSTNQSIQKHIQKYMDSYRKREVISYLQDNTSPTVVDFFCGAGGMSLGFRQNGYKILLANDIEKVCTTTYSFNHMELPKDKVINKDIKELVDNIEDYVSQEVDVVIGGPPCQGFSMANRQRLINDPRNILYKYYVKAIEKLKPKFFIMENVKGMSNVADQVIEDFHDLNSVRYEVASHIFNAKDFSVPQNRERLIFVGVREDIMQLIKKSPLDIIEEIQNVTSKMTNFTLSDAIDDLKELEALTIKNATELDTEKSGKKVERYNLQEDKDLGYINLINQGETPLLIFNHKARYNNDRDIEIFGKMLPGDKSDSERIADIMPYKSRNHIFKDKYYKLKPNDVCKTITAHMKFDCNMYIHPRQARGLTPREAARVQSYPDDYFFLGPYTKTYMQIGNSVPPLMTRVISLIIKKYI